MGKRVVLSRRQILLLLLWIAFCMLAYRQLGKYVALFFTHYGPRYFPFLGGLLW